MRIYLLNSKCICQSNLIIFFQVETIFYWQLLHYILVAMKKETMNIITKSPL